MSSNEPVSIHIFDREYTVGVEPGERSSLMAAAKLLDSKMREVRGATRWPPSIASQCWRH